MNVCPGFWFDRSAISASLLTPTLPLAAISSSRLSRCRSAFSFGRLLHPLAGVVEEIFEGLDVRVQARVLREQLREGSLRGILAERRRREAVAGDRERDGPDIDRVRRKIHQLLGNASRVVRC
jgi:hypothetical protein